MRCLDQDTVVALMEGRLSEDVSSAVDDHMDGCAICRELVAEVARGSLVQTRTIPGSSSSGSLGDLGLDLVPGQLFAGRFRIKRRIGRGAMGVVYEATDEKLGLRVALKMLPPESADNTSLMERLRQEMVLGRRITHANVCRLFDLGDADGKLFLSMEFIEGETLRVVIDRERPAIAAALRILDQIAEALQVAHEHGVVHRDLKPSNIMIGPDGKVTVMDFGLARDLHADRSESGLLVGTPAYWAPEQARGERATTRSDIYTFGVIACELLGGTRPSWDAEPSLSGVPTKYASVLRGCLQPLPERRIATVTELRELLRAPDRAPKELRRGKQPHRKRYLLIVAIAGSSLGAVGVYAASRLPDELERPADPAALEPAVVVSAAPVQTAGDPRGAPVVHVIVEPEKANILRGEELLGLGHAELRFDSSASPSIALTFALPGYQSRSQQVGPADAPFVRVRLERLSGARGTALGSDSYKQSPYERGRQPVPAPPGAPPPEEPSKLPFFE